MASSWSISFTVLAVGFPLSLYFVSWMGSVLRAWLLAKETGVIDLEYVGQPRGRKIHGTAVICGGSIAGLLAARVSSAHFERVVIVETEAWLVTEEGRTPHTKNQTKTRSRVMQYSSLHGNLSFFYVGLRKLFPSLDAVLAEGGVRVADSDFKITFWGVPYIVPELSGPFSKAIWGSRKAVETAVRRLTLNSEIYSNIEQVVGTVQGVQYDPLKPHLLSSVNVRREDGSSLIIEATLVVDCTGPSQAGLKWINKARSNIDGTSTSIQPATVRFDPDMRYATFVFDISPEQGRRIPIPGGWDRNPGGIYVCIPDPKVESKYFSSLRNEDNKLVVCCGSWGPKNNLPKTVAGIKEYTRSIHVKQPIPAWFFTMLDVCEESEDTMQYGTHKAASYWTHFENVPDLPSNWIAIGDSVCRLNPLYSTGCPKALVGCLALNTLLSRVPGPTLPANFGQKFFDAQAAKITPLWVGAKTTDYLFDTTVPEPGEQTPTDSLLNRYIRRLQVLSSTDNRIGALLWQSQMLLGVSIDILHPVVIFKVLWHTLRHPST